MKTKKNLVKSAAENENETEDQFVLDEQAIDEISNAEEFADEDISHDDIMDAVEVIDALATAVIEKADVEEKKVDADELLDELRDLIDDSHEEEPETEEIEESELPAEIESSVVRVMVSENGDVELEQKPDEIYNADVDGLECTVFDTVDDYPTDLDDTADVENVEDDTLIIGNSVSGKYKKGYITVKSSANKKAWSAAYKKVKKMVGSSKLTAAHWAIVSAIAKKEEEKDKLKKKIECKLIKYIRSNKELKSQFMKFIKSDMEPEIAKEGQTEKDIKSQTAEPKNNGFEETKGADKDAGNPDGTTSQFGNPTEDPDKQNEREGEVILPEESIVVVDVPLTNSVRHVKLQKVHSSKMRGYNLYKVMNGKDNNILDGKVIRSGKFAYAFRATSQGVIACCAAFDNCGKGNYKPVIKNEKVVIGRGVLAPVFQNFELVQLGKVIMNSHREMEKGRRPVKSARRLSETMTPKERKEAIRSAVERNRNRQGELAKAVKSARKSNVNPQTRKPVVSAHKPMTEERRQMIQSKFEARRAEREAQKAIESKAELQKMHEAEERQRLFQSSQTQMNEEKVAIKSANTRNTEALNKIYNSMF